MNHLQQHWNCQCESWTFQWQYRNQMKFEWKVWYIIQKIFLRNIISKTILSNLDTIWERYEILIFLGFINKQRLGVPIQDEPTFFHSNASATKCYNIYYREESGDSSKV